ncbi:MAG TPA: helix-turn-helix domain-containing protein [Erysipelothrix sp.]
MDLLKIGEMAKLNNVSVQTLRYYDNIDLLKPNYIDDETQYRYYTLSQSAELDLILFLSALDFSLNEIKTILNNPKQYDLIESELKDKAKQLQKEKRAIETKCLMINQFQDSYDCFKQNQDACDVRIEYFPERAVHTFQCDKNIYDMCMLEYEKNLRKFKLSLKEQGLGDHYFANVGSIMNKEDFINAHYQSHEMFIFTGMDYLSKNSKIIPAGHYAVSFCHLFENELEAIASLHAYLKEAQFEVIGDYICEVIYELPYAKPDQRNMFIRLQVPVKTK